ncbi:hypothetical protein BCR42DRAFT_425592 [Absidia repens]|uniref:WRKY domain-containing protein n=1 Tax=Absidia repens TaxID=90262 RepID=A0A1X2I2L2_9FUNG|nr:hypothetical protein BCR42DRAFT_425592 [Absidia repens]
MADTCASTLYNNNNSNNNDSNDHDHQQERHPINNTSLSTPLYELQHVFDQYKTHPELLKLILTSKVEEDKRRTEEAKLRSKELDYYLKHDTTPPSPTPNTDLPTPIVNHPQQQQQRRKMSIPSRINVNCKRLPDPSAPYSLNRQHHTTAIITSPTTTSPVSPSRKDSSIDHQYHHQKRRHSAATAMLAMGSSVSPSSLPSLSPSIAALPDQANNFYSSDEEMDPSTSTINAYPSPTTTDQEVNAGTEAGKPRRRREMLAITKIVETREFPYMDNYFWRNNGNTTQKKTGCRSIYYKCSNSNKGCQVNKTVTAKQNGEYLIKYRGNHMAECGMVERVRDL